MIVLLCKVCVYVVNSIPVLIHFVAQNPAVKKYDLSSLRFIMCGAAPLSGELTQQATQLLPHVSIHQAYG